MYIYIHICMCMRMCICVCICGYVYMHACMHVCIVHIHAQDVPLCGKSAHAHVWALLVMSFLAIPACEALSVWRGVYGYVVRTDGLGDLEPWAELASYRGPKPGMCWKTAC